MTKALIAPCTRCGKVRTIRAKNKCASCYSNTWEELPPLPKKVTKHSKIVKILTDNPFLPNSAIKERINCHNRTIQRAREAVGQEPVWGKYNTRKWRDREVQLPKRTTKRYSSSVHELVRLYSMWR